MKFKKFILFTCLFLCLSGIALFFYKTTLREQANKISASHAACPFCNPDLVKYQGFYESSHVLGLFNYRPVLEGHVLILPKRHVERLEDLTTEEFIEIKEAITKIHTAAKNVYGKNDYLLIIQNGKDAGQTVPHVHFHLIPRGHELTLVIKAKLWLSFLTDIIGLHDPISAQEMFKNTDALKRVIQKPKL